MPDIQPLDATKLLDREGWDCAKCGHRHAGPTLANICVGCPCRETSPTTEEDAWIRIATENAKDANARVLNVLSDVQKMFVLLAEIRQCINDDNLMAAQRKVMAIETILKQHSAVSSVPPNELVHAQMCSHVTTNGQWPCSCGAAKP